MQGADEFHDALLNCRAKWVYGGWIVHTHILRTARAISIPLPLRPARQQKGRELAPAPRAFRILNQMTDSVLIGRAGLPIVGALIVASVPEPFTMGMLLPGIVALGLLQRRTSQRDGAHRTVLKLP